MEAAGSVPKALEPLAAANTCLQVGQNLCERYRDIRGLHKALGDLNIRMENVWIHIAYQLGRIQSSLEAAHDVLRDHITDLLNSLQLHLHTAWENLERLTDTKGRIKAIKFFLFLRGSLEKDVSVLEKWRDMFSRTSYMLSLPKNPTLDGALSMETKKGRPDDNVGTTAKVNRGVLADGPPKQPSPIWMDPVRMHLPSPIGYSGAQVIFDNATNRRYIIETITVDSCPGNCDQLGQDVEKLARVLRESNGVPGVLSCKGVVRKQRVNGTPEKFEFILEIPHGLGGTPDCLRSILHRSTQEPHPLEERFHLAKQIAKAVIFVHNLNFVHKKIRPEAILVFPNPGKILGIPFLIGFQMFRSADWVTYRAGDESWSENLYRHPNRQGSYPDIVYRMQHDIYSLGVVLLEIGMWTPFVGETGEPGLALSQIVPILQDSDQRKKATRVKKVLIAMAQNHLPPKVGTKYADIVVSCLSCLDRDSELVSGSEFLSGDGNPVGARHIQKVLNVLDEIEV
ncbi:hypothetical protein C7212DRAFT_289976 [Tuber magnatum]|uniref:Protein kinase domain-containing protein n=1 Tax=Tuber magnatum TaxID=42249 RepID=A0A317T2S7_9PEZI|nr:hypothetical protein C7212DRAFT_289976 [Tuber magnatum]